MAKHTHSIPAIRVVAKTEPNHLAAVCSRALPHNQLADDPAVTGKGIRTVLPLTEEQFRQIAECLGFHVLWFASGMALMDWSGERMIVWVGYDRENAFKRMATVQGKLMRRQRCQRMGARKGNVNYPHLAGDGMSHARPNLESSVACLGSS
jgi:hypothetical protein